MKKKLDDFTIYNDMDTHMSKLMLCCNQNWGSKILPMIMLNYLQTTKILNVILSTFNFHTQLVHTFDDFIHRCPRNMLIRTNTKLINQHTLHKAPYLFNP
jgi:hypothetical protein